MKFSRDPMFIMDYVHDVRNSRHRINGKIEVASVVTDCLLRK